MRARNIKPGFFENEELAELSFECRLLYIGLWCYADREGRFEWRPKRIKALIFPYDLKLNIDKMLNVMTCKGHVKTYNCNGKKYGFIPTFKNHNNPHPHEAKSKCPTPLDNINQQDKDDVIKCNDMSMECNADIMNDDIMNPDIMNDEKDDKKFKNENHIPYKEIIDYLNEQAQRRYKYKTESYKSLIKARWNEGHRLDDFKYVIEVKSKEWLNDKEYNKFLRPDTLFSNKFGGYRNQKRKEDIETEEEKEMREHEEYMKKFRTGPQYEN